MKFHSMGQHLHCHFTLISMWFVSDGAVIWLVNFSDYPLFTLQY